MSNKKQKAAEATPATGPRSRPSGKKVDKTPIEPVAETPSTASLDTRSIPLDQIDIDPGNYRKYYSQESLEELARNIKARGYVIAPVTVRPGEGGRFRLVVGERRYRASHIAEMPDIPCVIRNLSDEEAEEIQLEENVQREDPHPLHEAQGIDRLYARGKSTQEIADRLGKSVTWVYKRYKLANLIPALQELFLANKFDLSAAYQIAELSPESQQLFFDDHCRKENLWFGNLNYTLASYKCDLSKAPFSLFDAKLLPRAGACNDCQFNTAYAGMLIPDGTPAGRCTKVACFDEKFVEYTKNVIETAIKDHSPLVFITSGELPTKAKLAIKSLPAAESIPVLQIEDITLIDKPEAPDKDDFIEQEYQPAYTWGSEDEPTFEDEDQEDEDEEQEDKEQGGEDEDEDEVDEAEIHSEDSGPAVDDDEKIISKFNEEEYNEAYKEYEKDLAAYDKAISSGKALKGLSFANNQITLVNYYPVPSGRGKHAANEGKTINIKKLISKGEDTIEDLERAISNIPIREQRYKQLDKEKVQKAIHAQFTTQIANKKATFELCPEDRIMSRLIAFNSLTYQNRNEVYQRLKIKMDRTSLESVWKAVSEMTEDDEAYLIRAASLGSSGSQLPTTTTGYFLAKLAEGAGIDVATIQKQQDIKATNRQDRQKADLTLYKTRVGRKKRRANAA